jgi:hypothetical protein
MIFQSKRNFSRSVILWLAPIALLGRTTMNAQWSSPYGYTDDYSESRHHQHGEKHFIKGHQRQERFLYGNSWELRRHQQKERHELKHHQRDERRYGDTNRALRNSPSDEYYGRRY